MKKIRFLIEAELDDDSDESYESLLDLIAQVGDIIEETPVD